MRNSSDFIVPGIWLSQEEILYWKDILFNQRAYIINIAYYRLLGLAQSRISDFHIQRIALIGEEK